MLTLNLVLYLTAAVLEVALIILITWRKLPRHFNLFFLYLVCSFIGDAAITWILGNTAKFYLYSWLLQGIYSVLAFAVIIGIFKPAFRLIQNRFGIQAILFPLALLLFVDLAFWMRFHDRFGSDFAATLASVIASFNFGFCCLSTAVFFFAMWSEKHYKILRQYRLGILTGFGQIAIATLLAYLVRLNLGNRYEIWFQYIPGLAFLGAIVTWFLTFISEQPKPPRDDPEKVENLLRLLNDVIQTAKRIGRRIGIRFRIRLA